MWMENVLIIVQNNIVNAERRGKRQVLVRPSSKVIVKFLSVMQRHGMSSFNDFDIRYLLPFGTITLLPHPLALGVITTIDEVRLHPPLVLRLRKIKLPLETITAPIASFTGSVLTVEGTSP